MRVAIAVVLLASIALAVPVQSAFMPDTRPLAAKLGIVAMTSFTATLGGFALNELCVRNPKLHKFLDIALPVVAGVGVAAMFGSQMAGGGR
jgi:hypothetical protein